jgi:cytoskeletal protein CcmA (bactofilin family)
VNRLLKYKLQAGALQFAVFISVIIAILLAGALLLAYTHRFFIEQSKAIVENIQLTDSGIASLLEDANAGTDTLSIPVPDAPKEQTLTVHLSHWGLFELGYVKATHRQKQFIKCSLLGSSIKAQNRPALYLNETFKPLAVVGETRIEGNSWLPEQGIRPGNISGNSYYGTDLIFGNIKSSTTELPKLKYDYIKELDYYINIYHPEIIGDYIPVNAYTKTVNSFKEHTKGYYSSGPIVLDNVYMQGNVIVRSDEKIIVRSSAKLKDVVLAAPIIIIEDNVKGNFQAIANATIKVGKNCSLSYPSALVLLKKDNPVVEKPDDFLNKISVDQSTTIRGSVCYLAKAPESDYKVNIFVDKQSSVKGEIYCVGNLELRGNVDGTVYTNQFLTNESGSVFVNHLYNARIISRNLPESFGGLLLIDESKSVMKWLY